MNLLSPYLLILFWFLIMSVMVKSDQIEDYKDGVVSKKIFTIKTLLVVLPLLLWATFRSDITGDDTYSYITMYNHLPTSLNSIPEYFMNGSKDPGFTAFLILIKHFISNSHFAPFFIVAFIQILCLVKVYKKYSVNYVLSIFLFVVSGDYLAWMLNAYRQFFVVSILFFHVDWLLEKKYIRLFTLIVILSFFHQSILVVIPFIFICQGKAWNKKTILLLIISMFCIAYLNNFTTIIADILQETQYDGMTNQIINDDGVNVLRALIYIIPTLMSLIFISRIRAVNIPIINLATNMSIISAAFYIVGVFTSGMIIGRLPIYFSLYNYILLPWIIKNVFEKNSAKLITVIMIFCYLMYYIYQMHFYYGYF